MKDNYTYPLNDDRVEMIERLRLMWDDDKDPGANELPTSRVLDRALQTTLELHENLQEHGDEIPPTLTRKLSTKHVGVHYRTNVYPRPVDY